MMPGGIAVVTSGFPRRSETFLLNELLALDARGTLAAVFATKAGDGGPLHPGCARLLGRVELLPAGSASTQAARLAERLRGREVTGIHGYFAHRPAAVAAHAARRLGVPYGFSVHARDARKVTPAALAARARRAACVIACNRDIAAELARAGAPSRVLPHGVDTHRFRPRPEPRGVPLCLLAVGRLVEKKGFETLIEAAARLGERVTLAGPGTHADLPAEYARAHVVVLPSVADRNGDRDGLPNVVLEALASARAVVASDVGAVATAVLPGRTGVLVPPGDAEALARALELLARRPDWRKRLGREGRAYIERRFELGRCTERLGRVLERAYG